MFLQKIPFRATQSFTEFFLKYIEQDPTLKSFFSRFPVLTNFKEQQNEKAKTFSPASRQLLLRVLQRQYSNLPQLSTSVKGNIEALTKENCFTVTTGHQLSIFTGPLYFIYKIVTVINACNQLKKQNPDSHYVPVFWMASEDHDYEEIRSFRLYGKKYTWETQQQGAVGRFHTKDFEKLLKQLPGDVGLFRDAYLKNGSLAEAVRVYVNDLFKEDGLVIIDADDRELKEILRPVMRVDLFLNTPNALVSDTNKRLEELGFHPQVNPREINFFYLDKNLRSRLERQGDAFRVVDTDFRFSKAELDKIIEDTPERISPNVILRPLYQELILPNLAYVGGPAELVYWLELKSMFEHFSVPFPMLLPRNFALIVEAPLARKLSNTSLEVSDFFEDKNSLFKKWVIKNSNHDLSLAKAVKEAETVFDEIQKQCSAIDSTLSPMVLAQAARTKQAMEVIEKKMIRAEKRLQSDKLRQIEAVKDGLFPNGGLQERTDNFLNFFQQDPGFISELRSHFDPFDFQFNVLSYHDQTRAT